MKNPCGTTRATIYEQSTAGRLPVYFGSGVNPVNSPAQYFVAWGADVLAGGLIPTFNNEGEDQGFVWFVDEDAAEQRYLAMLDKLK
ncbi:MAG TPA: hypothetical protein VHS59_11720 [Bacillota bacterium]|nr:hypothetical protein [Bacillota bacterium]